MKKLKIVAIRNSNAGASNETYLMDEYGTKWYIENYYCNVMEERRFRVKANESESAAYVNNIVEQVESPTFNQLIDEIKSYGIEITEW